MVIPWDGYSLSELIKFCEPLPSAKYVQFNSLFDKKQMRDAAYGYDWPYSEGLRMDEAMNPLALLTFGCYGNVLPNQNGSPIRVILPWKYGFKSAKSIVKLNFAAQDHLERAGSRRVRLLLQRQPEGRPSPLVSGPRAPHRLERLPQNHPHPPVQRLRRSGRQPLQRHGSQKVLLKILPIREIS
jgi:DMSO/TMAO reductase YedYZ molybdopterin-dependent catalytic subunit